jgi:hypothetical protein
VISIGVLVLTATLDLRHRHGIMSLDGYASRSRSRSYGHVVTTIQQIEGLNWGAAVNVDEPAGRTKASHLGYRRRRPLPD